MIIVGDRKINSEVINLRKKFAYHISKYYSVHAKYMQMEENILKVVENLGLFKFQFYYFFIRINLRLSNSYTPIKIRFTNITTNYFSAKLADLLAYYINVSL